MCSYPPKKITVTQSDWQNHSQTDRTTVSLTESQLTEPQSDWQNHSETDRTTVRAKVHHCLNIKWDWPGFDIFKPYICVNHILQANCLQSFSKQPFSIICYISTPLIGWCHHHTFAQHTVIHPFEIAHRKTDPHMDNPDSKPPFGRQ